MAESGRKLNELRVCDLKAELEKRKLDTVGPKASLVERLEKALKGEGLDPIKHIFDSNDRKIFLDSPPKKPQQQQSYVMIKEEPADDMDDDQFKEVHDNGDYKIDQVGDVDDECIIIEDEVEESGNHSGNETTGKRYETELSHDENHADGDNDTNNHDNDESINLTIGEDEQKLLHDEAPDDKEKTADINNASKDKAATSGEKQKEERSDNLKKDAKKSTSCSKSLNDNKEKKKNKDTSSPSKTKGKDEKHSSGKEKASEVKTSSSTKTVQKDNKEKSSNNTAAAAAAAESSTPTGNTTNSPPNTPEANPAIAKSIISNVAKITSASRNLWVSGLAAMTRASDLKTIFTKYGKVIGAKVVTNTRTPGHRCYGYVTMSSSADASRCIEHLHRTELHGRIISVERTKNEIGGSTSATISSTSGKEDAKHESKRRDDGKGNKSSVAKNCQESRHREDKNKGPETGISTAITIKKEEENAIKESKRDRNEGNDDKNKPSKEAHNQQGRSYSRNKPSGIMNRPRITSREREQRQRERERMQRERVRQRKILTYQKIREERERQRLREKERALREEERRRREIRDRQRQEEVRLAEERRKLAQERERLEREKAELLRLERERQKLEREKLELERLELKRQQMKIIQSRDDTLKPRHGKRSSTDRYTDASDRKRAPLEGRFEVPPPPRFDASLVNPRSSKRDDYVSSSSGSTKRHESHDYAPSSVAIKPRGGLDYLKRDDYPVSDGVAASKRVPIDDYQSVSAKRSSGGDFLKRPAGDYVSSSKRGIGTHRDDYVSSKVSSRDTDIRHISVTASGGGGGGSGSYHKSGRYGDSDRVANSSGYRRGGLDDIRSSTGGNKRYENSSGYGGQSGGVASGSANIWNGSSGGHISHSSTNNSGPTLKSYVSNGMNSSGMHGSNWQKQMSMEDNSWRPVPSSQDRYDRTYNERSSGYPSGGNTNIYGTSNGRSAPDRYGAPISRY